MTPNRLLPMLRKRQDGIAGTGVVDAPVPNLICITISARKPQVTISARKPSVSITKREC